MRFRSVVMMSCAVLVCGQVAGADTVAQPISVRVETALMSGTEISISGSGFSTKPTAKPVFFQPFTDTEPGSDYRAAGFDIAGGSHNGAKRLTVDMTDGVGGGSMLHNAPCFSDRSIGGESFHHLSTLLPPGTDEAFASCWVKLTRTGGTPSGLIQIKGMRMSTADGESDAQALYYRKPKFAFSVFLNTGLKVQGNHTYWWASNDRNEHRDDSYQATQTYRDYDNVWVSWEAYCRYNDVGKANGEMKVTIAGKVVTDLNTLNIKQNPDEHLGYVQYSPGITNGTLGADWEFRISRCYVDTSRARVFLGDAPELSACHGRFIMPVNAWADTVITASLDDRPENYDWIYVCTADGVMSQAGLRLPSFDQ